MAKNQPKTQAERFEEVRTAYPAKEDFRESMQSENVKTLRNSAKEFEINLEGRDSKEDILNTIVDSVYADAPNAGAPEGSGEGTGGDDGDNTNAPAGAKPTPAHDSETDEAAKAAADKVADGDELAPSAAANKLAMDSTTINAEEMPGGEKGDVVGTTSPANPNEKFTENLEAKKARLAHNAPADESAE